MPTRRPTLADAQRVLTRTFGLDAFRPGQDELIRHVLAGHDAVGVMPTGAGKSLCYQIPALLLPGTTVVVSPLISLMKDQVDKLADHGLDAASMNSTLTTREESDHLEQIADDRHEFVLTTPERLATEAFRDTLRETTIDLIVVDEAHCVSQWGHDFRPAYLEIRDAIADLSRGRRRPPVLALTATAPAAVLEDVVRGLGLIEPVVVNTGVYRPNLHLTVHRTVNEPQKRERLVQLLTDSRGAGIIYAATVRQVDLLHALLEGFGFRVAKYHGRLTARQRREHQDRFMAGDLQAMVATNAFGMGIDKPDIRFVVHYAMPGSLEAYYQEAGRAGRDGEAADCRLFFQLEDRRTQQFFLGGRYPRADEIGRVYDTLLRVRGADGTVEWTNLLDGVSDVGASRLRVILSLLKSLDVVTQRRGARYDVVRSDLSGGVLAAMADAYDARQRGDREKLEQMMHYGQTTACRWKTLLDYFGEQVEWDRCGTCDTCLQPPEGVHHPAGGVSPVVPTGASSPGRPRATIGADPHP